MAKLNFSIQEITPEEAEFSYSEEVVAQSQPTSFHGQIIGQPRAVTAIEMGIRIPGKGYNIFVTGESGTGRTTAIRKILHDQPFHPEKLQDIAFIHNFIKPEYPSVLYLSPGKGRKLVLAMQDLIRCLKEHIIERINAGDAVIDEKRLAEAASAPAKKIRNKFDDPKISEYLDQGLHDIENAAYIFNGVSGDMVRNTSFFNRYTVNLLIDHAQTKENPMVFENHPTFSQLMGSINSKSDQNEENLPFLSIHGGSLLESSGGCLVAAADEILKEEHLWDKLKQVLKTSHLYIQNPSSSSGHPGGIRPEPVLVDCKIILLGTEDIYDYLYSEDPDFYKLF
jgi:predicted ATP-dependent protease